jgi:hypothetical protein
LAIYNQTAIADRLPLIFESDGCKADLLLDVPAVVEENEYSHTHPELFPFHNRFTQRGEWLAYLERVHCLFSLLYARAEEVAELLDVGGASAIELADRVRGEIGPLSVIPKVDRRRVALSAFDELCAASTPTVCL